MKATVEVGMRGDREDRDGGAVYDEEAGYVRLSERARMTERRRQSIPRKARMRMIGMKRQVTLGIMEVGGRPS